jgi:histone acetyltransferase (RNA polymerase elongator complex component)
MPLIIPIFLMNRGCSHRCVFCNQRLTAGDHPERITDTAFAEAVRSHLASAGQKSGPVQIAFYGGTSTGLEPEVQRRLLELASPFLREGSVDGIRISTRPDAIDSQGLDLLRRHGVTTVELGVQSLRDKVLLRSQRGHTAADAVSASALLREKGFETGIHLMVGLPGDSPEGFAETIDRTIDLRPEMVRIHPTLVLRDTLLADSFRQGDYLPLGLADAVDLCREAFKALTAVEIPVIRLGLQTTRELEEPGAVVAGPFHPAFRSLVETALFFEMASALLSSAEFKGAPPASADIGRESIRFTVSPHDLSSFYGAKRANIGALEERCGLGPIRVSSDPALPRRTLLLSIGEKRMRTDCSGRIVQL